MQQLEEDALVEKMVEAEEAGLVIIGSHDAKFVKLLGTLLTSVMRVSIKTTLLKYAEELQW